jgi:hypothetical protein
MKPKFFSLTAAILATVAPVSILAIATAAQANDTNPNPLADFQQQQSDPFSNRGGDSSSGMMDFMHRVMQGPGPDMGTFSAANRENLNDAASAFRAKQQRLLLQRQVAAGKTSMTTPNGTILLPGALSTGVAPGSLILAPNVNLPAPTPAPVNP